jgi:hypothetical protein
MSYGCNNQAYHNGNEDAYSQFTYQPSFPLYIPTFNNNNNPYGEQWTPEYREEHVVQHNDYAYSLIAQPPTEHYNHTTQIESPQPPPNHAFYMHPNSAAAQSGLTPAEIEEDCIRKQTEWLKHENETDWMVHKGREYKDKQEEGNREGSEKRLGLQKETEEVEGVRPEQDNDGTEWVHSPTAYLEPEQEVYKGHGMAYEPPQVATLYDDDTSSRGDTPPACYQPLAPISDTQPLPPPLGHMHDTANNDDAHVIEFEYRDKCDNGASDKEPNHDMIKLHAFELAAPGVIDSTWAEEMERKHGYTLNSEYMQDNYPPVPSPVPWYPPPPSKLKYKPPQTHYTSSCTWYNPPHISMPPVPPLHPSLARTMSSFRKTNMSCDHDAT